MAEPGEVRRNPENHQQVAIATAPSVTAGDWFVFSTTSGGHYSDGSREGVDDWEVMGVLPPT